MHWSSKPVTREKERRSEGAKEERKEKATMGGGGGGEALDCGIDLQKITMPQLML